MNFSVWKVLLFSLSLKSVFSLDVALFRDWSLGSKGPQTFFQEGDPSVEALLAQKMQERGELLIPWEQETYLTTLGTWRSVKNWQGALDWMKSWGRLSTLIPETTRYWLFWGLGPTMREVSLGGLPREKLVLFLWEPPTVQGESYRSEILNWFGKVFTWDDDLVDGVRFFKFHYPVWGEPLENLVPFAKRRFCVMINRRLASRFEKELYREREKTIRSFEKRKDLTFDLFGPFWEKRGYQCWRGPLLTDKLEKLQQYKFCICYENTQGVKGYVTEKIFDCLRARVVPVYWGAENIESYVPKECFIDRRLFANAEEMILFLEGISAEEHQKYIEAGERFLRSDAARLFSKEAFVKNVIQVLYETEIDRFTSKNPES